MGILYRRFIVVAALIAAMAALTANLIVETRREPTVQRISTGVIQHGNACTNDKICLSFKQRKMKIFQALG